MFHALVISNDAPLVVKLVDVVSGMGGSARGPASSVEAGLSFLETETFDIVLHDVDMEGPAQNRIDRALAHKFIPVVMMSRYPPLYSAAAFPAYAHLRKPFDEAALETTLRSLLGLGGRAVVDPAEAVPSVAGKP